MRIQVSFQPPQLYEAVHELIRMAYPKAEISRSADEAADVYIGMERQVDHLRVKLSGFIQEGLQKTVRQDDFALLVAHREERSTINRVTRRFAYDMLAEHRGEEINSYGILTGMRPVKLVHRLLDSGLTASQIRETLTGDFRMNPDKADLVLEVAGNNHPYLLEQDEVQRLVGLYIGIPYCPTRCYYCSFPGAILPAHGVPDDFLTALFTEMKAVADCLAEGGQQVQSIYIGGGTPTVLSEQGLNQLFDALKQWFVSSSTVEITVEAGRPDTLTPGKLRLLKEAGANRVCINPQTMNDVTLTRMGRHHDSKGVVQSVIWAKEAGFRQVNMDLIVGLPGEGTREYRHTAEEILKLAPENVTVHTLAVKRGSAMAEREGRESVGDRIQTVHEGLRMFAEQLRGRGYRPYYLYRQKYMQASMENVGYARPGHFCLYNMQMIEEKQTIIGMGGGAASKFVDPGKGTLHSLYNPKNPEAYLASVKRLIAAKVDNLRALH